MPELRAFHPVSTALDRTKKLLFEPLDAWVWLKLIIIMFFIGSGSSSFNPSNAFRYSSGNPGEFSGESFSNSISSLLSEPAVIAAIVLLILAVIAIILIFSYLRGVFSFVLIDALTTGQLHIIKPFKENMGRGLKVFVFNLVMLVISFVFILSMLAVMLLTIFWIVGMSNMAEQRVGMIIVAVGILLFTLLVFLAFSVLTSLIIGFFYDFAIPLMRFKNMGLTESIMQVLGLVRKEPLEFFVYMVLRWALEAVIGLIFGIINLCILAVFLALGIIVILIAATAAKLSLWLLIPFILLIVIGLALMIIIMAVISMPIGVYFRYFSLDFLRSFDPAYVPYTGRFAPTVVS
jgi:hypothetical protein